MDGSPVVRIAPFILARVAGQPLLPLIEMAPPRTAALVDAAVAERSQADSLRPALEEALHAVVPALGPPARAAALKLKRAAHNSRDCDLDGESLSQIASRLPAAACTVLDRWMALQRSAANHLDEAIRAHDEELIAHVRPRLAALAGSESFRRPLVLASRSVFDELIRQTEVNTNAAKITRLERTLVSYLARASAKTSPFSTFMYMAALRAEGEGDRLPGLDPASRRSYAESNRGLVFAIRSVGLGCCGDRRHTVLTVNQTVAWGDGIVELMSPWYGMAEGRVLRLSRRARIPLSFEALRLLSRLPRGLTWGDLLDAFGKAGLPPDRGVHLAQRLLDVGFLAIAQWTDAFQPQPEASERLALDACDRPSASCVRNALDSMSRAAMALPAADSAARSELLAQTETKIADAFRALGVNGGAARMSPVLENACFRLPAGPIGEPVRGILDDIANVLRGHIERSPGYSALDGLFLQLYGADGTCYDAADFLCRAAESLGRAQPDQPPPGPQHPVPGRPAVPATVLLQLLGDGHRAEGAVINHVYAGCGWLSARHAAGNEPFHNFLRESLRDWLAEVAAPAEPVDIVLSGDCNPLQSHPRLTNRVLLSPMEPCLSDGALTLRDVKLRRNEASGEIRMYAGATLLAPVYLGTTYPNPGWGPMYWLTVLALPWRIRPIGRPERVKLASGVSWHARSSVGRIVVERASWIIESARLRQVWFGRTGALQMADAVADCVRFGIPRFFYVRAFPRPEKTGTHKPMWVDSRNPLLLAVMRSVCERSEEVSITEALPAQPTWPVLDGCPHASELQVELLL